MMCGPAVPRRALRTCASGKRKRRSTPTSDGERPAPEHDRRGAPAGTPNGCEECLLLGTEWVHLRQCLTCGHVGCCRLLLRSGTARAGTGPARPATRSCGRSKPGERAGAGAMSTNSTSKPRGAGGRPPEPEWGLPPARRGRGIAALAPLGRRPAGCSRRRSCFREGDREVASSSWCSPGMVASGRGLREPPRRAFISVPTAAAASSASLSLLTGEGSYYTAVRGGGGRGPSPCRSGRLRELVACDQGIGRPSSCGLT